MFTIGLTVDAALARFMAGQRGQAVAEFGAVVAELETLARSGSTMAPDTSVASCWNEQRNKGLSFSTSNPDSHNRTPV